MEASCGTAGDSLDEGDYPRWREVIARDVPRSGAVNNNKVETECWN